MIDEAVGKILGMAMAYVASVLGMFLAYINYRLRIVKADKIMTPAAWTVILLSLLAVVGAVLVVGQLATPPADAAAPSEAEVAAPSVEPEVGLQPVFDKPAESRKAWPWIGILLPGLIFLSATWITAALHRHFTTHGHAQ